MHLKTAAKPFLNLGPILIFLKKNIVNLVLFVFGHSISSLGTFYIRFLFSIFVLTYQLYFFKIFIYLALLGLNCSMHDLIVMACELLLVVCGI